MWYSRASTWKPCQPLDPWISHVVSDLFSLDAASGNPFGGSVHIIKGLVLKRSEQSWKFGAPSPRIYGVPTFFCVFWMPLGYPDTDGHLLNNLGSAPIPCAFLCKVCKHPNLCCNLTSHDCPLQSAVQISSTNFPKIFNIYI